MNNLHHTFLFIILRFVYLNLYDSKKKKKTLRSNSFYIFPNFILFLLKF